MPAHLSLVPTPLTREIEPELVDPYAYSLAVAFLLSPDESEAEFQLEAILTGHCLTHGADMNELLTKCSTHLREAGVIS
jgi:hypothetical protein